MPKRVRLPRKKQQSYLAITNPAFTGYMGAEALKLSLSRFLTKASDHEFGAHFRRIYSMANIRRVMAASATSLDALAKPAYFRGGVTPARMLAIYETIIRFHKPDITAFLTLANRFEKNLLAGNYDAASSDLQEIPIACGESLWLARSKILLLSLCGKPEEMQLYAQQCKERLGQNFATPLINCTLLVTTNPSLQLSKTVSSMIREFAESNHQEWADLLTLYLMPQSLSKSARPLRCLWQIQLFTAVDQFMLLRSLMAHNLALLPDDLGSMQERSLLALLLEIERDAVPRNTAHNADLITLYEKGQYIAFRENFAATHDDHLESAALANLIAKSHAITDTSLSWLEASPFKVYLDSLISLYRLEDQPNQAEDTANAAIALMHHLLSASDFEHCLMRASPFSYPASLRAWAERRTRLLHPERLAGVGTPLADVTPETRHVCSDEELAPHRRVRKKLVSLLFHESPPDRTREIDEQLERYRACAPLQRDYFELLSLTLLKEDRHEELIAHAGRALALLPASYTAFPMEQLVSYIEESAAVSMDAVLVVYFHASRVDKTREYLLNETYEEFLVQNGVERPSDLIGAHLEDPSDPRYDVFFLDVSKIETMDFLSCFKSSNALRAERVLLLDHMQAHGKLDRAAHAAEVDEIVATVVVDSTATEFNVAKVDVNDEALKRALTDDVTSLQGLYRSYKDDGSERVIRVDDIGTDGSESLAMIAGNKSSALHKIVSLVVEAFISDEKHGLAKNLSAEIRHGFFSNHMRARAEEAHLLTELDQTGNYSPNIYWHEQYEILNGEALKQIDAALSDFSRDFNQLIAKAEEWMKIATSIGDDSPRAFRISGLYVNELNLLHPIAQHEPAERLIDVCFQILWSRTESALQDMRHRINVDLRHDVNVLFDDLVRRLDEIRGNAPLANLMNAVYGTKNGLQEDLTTISEWFRRRKAYTSEAERTVPELIRISLECLNRVRGCQLTPTLNLGAPIERRFRDGRSVRFFIIAMVNLLENCIKHSGLGTSADLEISTRCRGDTWSIVVSNSLSNERLCKLESGEMENIRERFTTNSGSSYALTEGKSGLPKVINHLRAIDDHFQLKVDIEHSRFQATISYA